jgi:hypothetical protein
VTEVEGTEADAKHELAIRTSVAVLAGGAALLGQDAGAAATALTPAMEVVAALVLRTLSQRRTRHAAEALEYGVDAADEPLEEFAEKAVADERRQELLARTLVIAQDTALRDKRRALGRALAAGIGGDDAKIDEELLFVRAVADIDTPHIRLLSLIASELVLPGSDSGSVFHSGWSIATMMARDPGLGEAIPALLSTLELHGLVSAASGTASWGGPVSTGPYNITAAGRTLLDRLKAEGSA